MFVFTALPAGCTTAWVRPHGAGLNWACTSRIEGKQFELTVTRALDGQGHQLSAEYQWSIAGFDRNRLSLMAVEKSKGPGDPTARPREVLVSWSGFSSRVERQRMLIVLHPAEEPANALDGVTMIPYTNGLVGAVVSWQRVASLARLDSEAQVSLLDARSGRVVRTAPVDLAKVGAAIEQTRSALDVTRARSGNFRRECERVAEGANL